MNTSVISEATPSLLSSFSLLHMPSQVPLSPSLPSDGSIVGHFHRKSLQNRPHFSGRFSSVFTFIPIVAHFHRKSPQNRPYFSGRFPYVLTLEDCSMSRQSLNLEQMWWAPSQFQDNSRKWAVLGGIAKSICESRSLCTLTKNALRNGREAREIP
jgi:hypothetical protein